MRADTVPGSTFPDYESAQVVGDSSSADTSAATRR